MFLYNRYYDKRSFKTFEDLETQGGINLTVANVNSV